MNQTMSYYQEGYDKGYADGSVGEPSNQQWPYHLADFLTNWDEAQTEYEEGYDEGYEDGKEEWDSHQDN